MTISTDPTHLAIDGDQTPPEALEHAPATNEGGIAKRAIRSGYWLLGLRASNQLLNVVKLLVLARLLAPDQFGVMGVALLTIGVVSLATETGLEQALIQRKGDIDPYMNSAWTLLVARGTAILTILWLAGPLASQFFRVPEASTIVRVIGVALFIEGFANISIVRFKKQLDFRRQVVYELSGVVTDVLVSIIAAIVLRNVWALVFGRVAGSAVQTLVSYAVLPHRPRLDFNRERAGELLHFGKWILGSSVLVFLLTQGDDMLVGRVLGAASLGLYQMAYRVACLPATEITSLISTVTFPAYSLMQDDIPRLRSAYERVLVLTSVLSFFLAGAVFALGRDSVVLFMGEKWLPMVASMQVLVWWGIVRGLNSSQSPVFLSLGKPKVVTRQQAVQAVLMYASILPLMWKWGILGASVSVLGAALVLFFWRNQQIIKTLEWTAWPLYRTLAIPGAVTLLSVLSTYAVRQLFPDAVSVTMWISVTATFVAAFAALMLAADRLWRLDILRLARQTLSRG